MNTPVTNKSETRLSVSSSIPFNFKFEVKRLPDGCLETSKIQTDRLSEHIRSAIHTLTRVADELRFRFAKEYDFSYDDVMILASYTPEGELEFVLRSKVPYSQKLQSELPKKQLNESVVELEIL